MYDTLERYATILASGYTYCMHSIVAFFHSLYDFLMEEDTKK